MDKVYWGGLIKFPHENLREVEIDGDGAEGGGGGNNEEEEIFFKFLTIQPNAVIIADRDDNLVIKTINEFTFDDSDYDNYFCFSKEELIKVGFNSEDLDNLQETDLNEIDETGNFSELILIDNSIFENNIILNAVYVQNIGILLKRWTPESRMEYYLYKVRNDIGINTYSIFELQTLG